MISLRPADAGLALLEAPLEEGGALLPLLLLELPPPSHDELVTVAIASPITMSKLALPGITMQRRAVVCRSSSDCVCIQILTMP